LKCKCGRKVTALGFVGQKRISASAESLLLL
jgi:hypothetical protein